MKSKEIHDSELITTWEIILFPLCKCAIWALATIRLMSRFIYGAELRWI